MPLRLRTAALLLLFVGISTPAMAQLDTVQWENLPYTEMSDFEQIDSSGLSTYPANAFPIRMVGILLNNPSDMLDSMPNFNTIPFDLGGQWQVFVQSTLPNDEAGVALYMGQNNGNIPPNLTFTPAPTPEPSASFTDEAWSQEIARLAVDQATGHVFQAGDLVEIHAQGGLFFGGKMNVNSEHSTDSSFSFEMTLITANYGLPDPVDVSLESIWDDSTDNVLFDSTRVEGGEKYQGMLVNLTGVHVVDGIWGSNELVTVADADGREIPLQLGNNPIFDSMTAPAGLFNIVGIFDQEAPSSGPYDIGYELFVTDASGIVSLLPGDINGDGFVGQDDLNVILGEWGQTVAVGSMGDISGDGFIGQDDLNIVLAEWGQGTVSTALSMAAVPEASPLLQLSTVAFSLFVLSHARRFRAACVTRES